MNIEDLKNKFETVANEDVDIATFIFDDLSTINKNRQKKYPVVLMKAPQSTIAPFSSDFNTPIWENFNITFFLLKTWTTEDKKTKSLDQIYRECDDIADKYLKNILSQGGNEYSLIDNKSITKNRGHHQYVDQLAGVQYNITLRVFNSLCYGLNQPTNLNATITTDNQIDLTWTDNATTETGYEVWRSTDLINYTLAASTAADSTSYNDTGLTAGTIYHYKVRAFDANGGGEFSNVSSKMVLSGIAYLDPQWSGQNVSYNTYDEGWQKINGILTRIPPPFPISFARLDLSHVDPYHNLVDNNAFGNKDRFTDINGLQVYGDDYVIDHLTGKGFYRLSMGVMDIFSHLTNIAASTQNGFNDWLTPSLGVLSSIRDYESLSGGYLTTSPFNLSFYLWTSTNRPLAGANYLVITSLGNTIQRIGISTYNAIMYRNHYT